VGAPGARPLPGAVPLLSARCRASYPVRPCRMLCACARPFCARAPLVGQRAPVSRPQARLRGGLPASLQTRTHSRSHIPVSSRFPNPGGWASLTDSLDGAATKAAPQADPKPAQGFLAIRPASFWLFAPPINKLLLPSLLRRRPRAHGRCGKALARA
jgi:hypothetical protein